MLILRIIDTKPPK